MQRTINAGNRKVIIFTAFADTATYLYEQLAGWAKSELGIESAVQALAATIDLAAATRPEQHPDGVFSTFQRAARRPGA